MRIIAGSIAGLLLAAGCQDASQPEAAAAQTQPERYTVTVAPYTLDCVGVGLMQCLVIDGELFYDHIDGFEFEPGYAYQLLIELVQRFTPDTVPADASLYQYKLIEVLSVEQVDTDNNPH